MQRTFVHVFAVLAAALLLFSACFDDDSDLLVLPDQDPVAATPTEDTPTTTPSATTTSTPTATSTLPPNPTPEDGEDFDRYIASQVLAFYDLVNRAAENPSLNPEQDYPEFADLSAGAQLDKIHEAIARLATEGTAVLEPAEPAVGTSIEDERRISGTTFIEEGKVTVLDCEVDDEDLVDIATGEILSAGVLTILRTVTLEDFDGEWKVTFAQEIDKIRGVGGCFYGTYSDFPYPSDES